MNLPFSQLPCYHGRKESIPRATTLYELEDLVFHSASKLFENLRKRRKERVNVSLSYIRLFLPTSSLHGLSERQTPKNGTDPRYIRVREQKRRNTGNPIYGTMGSFEAEGNEGFGVSVSLSLSGGPIRNLTTLMARTGYLYTGCARRTVGPSLPSLPTAVSVTMRNPSQTFFNHQINFVSLLIKISANSTYKLANKLVTLYYLLNKFTIYLQMKILLRVN